MTSLSGTWAASHQPLAKRRTPRYCGGAGEEGRGRGAAAVGGGVGGGRPPRCPQARLLRRARGSEKHPPRPAERFYARAQPRSLTRSSVASVQSHGAAVSPHAPTAHAVAGQPSCFTSIEPAEPAADGATLWDAASAATWFGSSAAAP